MLQSVLGEAKRKNANCLSPAQRGEFLGFSEASFRTINMGKPNEERGFETALRKIAVNRTYF